MVGSGQEAINRKNFSRTGGREPRQLAFARKGIQGLVKFTSGGFTVLLWTVVGPVRREQRGVRRSKSSGEKLNSLPQLCRILIKGSIIFGLFSRKDREM